MEFFKENQPISRFSVSMDKKMGVSTIQKTHSYGGAIHTCIFQCVATKYLGEEGV